MAHQKTETPQADLGAVHVRPAQSSDLSAVVALDAENTGIAKAAYWKDRFEWYVGRHPDRFFLVAERSGKMLGFIVGEVRAWEFGSPPSGWISPFTSARPRGCTASGRCSSTRSAPGSGRRACSTCERCSRRTPISFMSFFRSLGMMAGPFIQLEKRLAP